MHVRKELKILPLNNSLCVPRFYPHSSTSQFLVFMNRAFFSSNVPVDQWPPSQGSKPRTNLKRCNSKNNHHQTIAYHVLINSSQRQIETEIRKVLLECSEVSLLFMTTFVFKSHWTISPYHLRHVTTNLIYQMRMTSVIVVGLIAPDKCPERSMNETKQRGLVFAFNQEFLFDDNWFENYSHFLLLRFGETLQNG